MAKPLYLGRPLDAQEPFLLDGDRLVTHGVVLGMTGSGKTGLSVTLLEELVLRGVPLLVIDPKGDLPNLALIFPEHNWEQFAPWTESNPEDAAESHRKGCGEWGIGQEKLRELRDKMELTIYTPGSAAGVPVDVLGAFRKPENVEDVQDLVLGTVSGLLSLVGVQADPVRSPEHIVLSQILAAAWSAGEELNLESLIVKLVDPPFKKVGVFPLDTFYPPEKRMELAMQLNGVLASPSFAVWTQGQKIDPVRFTQPASPGKTPVSVFYLAHLSEPERMFFVSLLLERVLAWSRTLSGTTSLQTLLYFDEVAGYIPPHPYNPASKKPLLTLMKQARAVGIGTVLATQNPVDIDYKGLANAGTWMIGRMQTAQDRERVADGLITAETGMDKAQLLKSFEQLKPRVFLIQGRLVHTRQTMSYLRGPLTRNDLAKLAIAKEQAAAPAPSRQPEPKGTARPIVPQGFANLVLDPTVVFSARLQGKLERFAQPHSENIRLQPALFGELELYLEEPQKYFLIRFPAEDKEAYPLDLTEHDLLENPPANVVYDPLPDVLDESHELKAAQNAMVEDVYRKGLESEFVHPGLKLRGTREEVEERIREKIEEETAKLHSRYDKEITLVQEKIRKLEAKLAQRQTEAQGRQMEQLYSAGEMLLGFFTGRKRSLSTAINKHRMTTQAKQRAQEANDDLAQLQDKIGQLQEKLESEVGALEEREQKLKSEIEERPVKLKKTDIRLLRFGVLWIPVTRRI